MNEYTLSDEFSERIIDEVGVHYKELYNYYIVSDGEVKSEYVEVVPIPDTKIDGNYNILFMEYIIRFFKGIFAFLG